MKKSLHKFTALALCLLLLGAFMLPAAAVSMPQGVSESRVQAALPKAEALVGAALSMSEETKDLSGSVYGLLFSDDTLNAIFSGVYSALSEQESTLSSLGVDLSVAREMQELSAYPQVLSALEGKENWKAVFSGGFSPKWNVRSKDGFAHALAAMFGPMNELLYTLLCGGVYRPNVLISVQGANGYENAVVPLLRALGTPDILPQESFTADAGSNRYSMVKNICAMLYSAIDAILASPVQKLCRVLPAAADYLVNGGLSAAMSTLVEPLKVRVGLVSLSGVDKMLENLQIFSSSADLTAMLEDMDTSALFGSDVPLELPKVDLEELAGCGVKTDGVFTPNEAQAFVAMFRWAVQAVKLNRDALPQMLGQDLSGAKDFLDKFLAKDADEILKMLLDLMELKPSDTVLEYRWEYPAYTPGTVEFTPNLTRADYERVLTQIDGTLNEFLKEFSDLGSLSGVLAARLYSGALVGELVKGVYGALYSEQTGPVLSLLGLDASPAGVAQSIASACPAAARTLRGYASWDKVNPAALSWGFANGNKEGFTRALTAVLTPFAPFLNLLLAEGQLTLLNVITVSGSNGYNTAVLPLLEALGCEPNTVKTYADYKRTANTSAAITDILTPVTELMDRLIASPVATMCAVLPNLVYFVNAGGLSQCMENLIYPVRVLLRTVGAEDLLSGELSKLTNIDLNKTVGDLIANSGLGISLPAPDLNKLASLGTAQTRAGKHTYNGMPADYTYIEADAPAVLVTVLRYVVGALGSEENAAAFSGMFQQDQTEEGDMMAMYTGKVAEQLKTMSTDETIEWLYNLLFAETPKKEKPAGEDAPIPTIIYQGKEKHTTRNVTAIVIAAVVCIVVLSVVLSRVDFGAWRDRRRHRKQRLKAAKARAQAQKYASAQAQARAGAQAKAKAQPQNGGAPQKAGPVQRTVTPQKPTSGLTEKERIRHERELIKMRVREEKAQQKAYRDTKKADKYYQQALKEQRKKH